MGMVNKYLVSGNMLGLLNFVIYYYYDAVLWYPWMLHHVPELVAFACFGAWFSTVFKEMKAKPVTSHALIVLTLVTNMIAAWGFFNLQMIASLIVSSPMLIGYKLQQMR